MINVPGLPEGVVVLRIGVAGPEDFELTSDRGDHRIVKGPRAGTSSQIIVGPAPGYKFAFDIKTLGYSIEKALEHPSEITVTLKYMAYTMQQQALIEAAIAKMKEIPGYVEP